MLIAWSPLYSRLIACQWQWSCQSCFQQPWRCWNTWMWNSKVLPVHQYGPILEVIILASSGIHWRTRHEASLLPGQWQLQCPSHLPVFLSLQLIQLLCQSPPRLPQSPGRSLFQRKWKRRNMAPVQVVIHERVCCCHIPPHKTVRTRK